MAEVGDIEDCGHGNEAAVGLPSAVLAPRTVNTKGVQRQGAADIPGDATVFVHTFGCGHNVSDGEYMAGQLAEEGYRITDDFENADCYLINSCTVKNPSEDHFVNLMHKAKKTGKPVVVAGCVPQGDPNNPEWSDVSIIGVRHIDQVGSVMQEALRGNRIRLLGTGDGKSDDAHRHESEENGREGKTLPPLKLKKIRRNAYVEIIPINVGCLNFCTYCKTKHARGNLQSYPVQEIVNRVKEVVAEGVAEIRLTSEDTGAYGLDIGTNIGELLAAIIKVLEGTDVMLRVGMSNPPYLLKFLDKVAPLLRHRNVYEFIHIPVQSGSNAILDAMKREYTIEEFNLCVDTFRRVVPGISIATDIICAFPGEGEKEWRETVDLCQRIRFPVLNMSRFYPRRGTLAAQMPQIPTDVAKRRTTELTKLYNSYQTYDDLMGTIHTIHILDVAHDKHHLIGHTKAYVQVLVDPREAKLGDRNVKVRVESVSKYSVKGRVISTDNQSGGLGSSGSPNQHKASMAVPLAVVGVALVALGVALSLRSRAGKR